MSAIVQSNSYEPRLAANIIGAIFQKSKLKSSATEIIVNPGRAKLLQGQVVKIVLKLILLCRPIQYRCQHLIRMNVCADE